MRRLACAGEEPQGRVSGTRGDPGVGRGDEQPAGLFAGVVRAEFTGPCHPAVGLGELAIEVVRLPQPESGGQRGTDLAIRRPRLEGLHQCGDRIVALPGDLRTLREALGIIHIKDREPAGSTELVAGRPPREGRVERPGPREVICVVGHVHLLITTMHRWTGHNYPAADVEGGATCRCLRAGPAGS